MGPGWGQRLKWGRGRWTDRQGPKKKTHIKTNQTEQRCWGLLPTRPHPVSTQRDNPNMTGSGSTQGRDGVVGAPKGWHPCPDPRGRGSSVQEPGAPWAEPDRAPHSQASPPYCWLRSRRFPGRRRPCRGSHRHPSPAHRCPRWAWTRSPCCAGSPAGRRPAWGSAAGGAGLS